MNMLRIRTHTFACLLAYGLACCVSTSKAADTHYVATTGNNGNIGSQESPWLTIGYAASQTTPGDIVRVQAGTYDEHVDMSTSGTSNSWITYVADGQAICRGFDLNGRDYIRIIGFEIVHVEDGAEAHGITLDGSSCIDIIDNYIHDVEFDAIRGGYGVANSYITVRGNIIDYIGHIEGEADGWHGNAAVVRASYPNDHHWLIEYNTASRCGDYALSYGENAVVRNNYFHDFNNAYWNNEPSIHSDIFQPGSDGLQVKARNQVYERNFCGDAPGADAHFGIWQDTVEAGDTNIVIRGNVAYHFGSTGIGVKSTDKVSTHNNTFYKICQDTPGTVIAFYRTVSDPGQSYAVNCSAVNTILYDYGASDSGNAIVSYTTANLSHNIGYMAGSESSYVSTDDPLFVDPTSPARDFRLQFGSPAIGRGTHMVSITSADGSGNTFNVNDGQLLIDGWGMVDGDTVTVGGTTTEITSISGNAVTVADALTWTNGIPVYWGPEPTVDIGALPYGSTPLTSATLIQNGTTYTVNTTGDTRGVWFYVDGIPVSWDSSSPYSTTITNGTVTAKAYALYAQADPVVDATSSSDSTRPAPPANIQVQPPE